MTSSRNLCKARAHHRLCAQSIENPARMGRTVSVARAGAALLVVASVLLAASGCAGMHDSRYKRAWRDKPAPDFELTALGGERVRLSDLRGKPVILTFWAHG